jgi:hypothetical protein
MDSAADVSEAEQYRREVAWALDDAQDALIDAAGDLLMRLSRMDCWGFSAPEAEAEERARIATRVARGALAAILADPTMRLPEHIDTYFDMPKSPGLELPGEAARGPARSAGGGSVMLIDEYFYLGQSIRERMMDQRGPYRVEPASVRGTWEKGAVIIGALGFSVSGIISCRECAEQLAVEMNEAWKADQ